MSFVAKLRWRIRKGFWNAVARFRYRGISPLPVKDLARLSRRPPTLTPIPLDRAFPSIPIPNVHRGDREPPGDRAPLYTLRSAVAGLLSRLASVFGPNQPDLPPIDADPQRAVDRAYTAGHRRTARRKAEATGVADRWALQPPVVPPELKGSPDLGGLAVRGPYAGYLHEVTSREFEWDLRDLGQFEHRRGLYRLGVRVLFRANGARSALEPFRIESDELGTTKPGDRGWPQAMRLAVCAASTHTSLVRHFNWVHLLGGEYLSLVCRNHLSPDHPLARLLWPHTFGTQQSNRLAVQSQLVPGGEFESFSLTHRGVCDLIGESVGRFQMSRFDPYDDALARGLSGAGIELPTESNMRRLFDVMLRHATRYLDVYYLTDEAVRKDRAIAAWVDGMNALVPNGVSLAEGTLGKAALARLLARCIYMVTAYHELVGAFLWNYQSWPDTHPIRVYADGSRERVDVHQRLVNTCYLLNVIRSPLVDDFSSLALDGPGHEATHPKAVAAFRAFRKDLEDLQASMDLEPDAVWRLHPMALEVNINA